jgi:hypothetical protein
VEGAGGGLSQTSELPPQPEAAAAGAGVELLEMGEGLPSPHFSICCQGALSLGASACGPILRS